MILGRGLCNYFMFFIIIWPTKAPVSTEMPLHICWMDASTGKAGIYVHTASTHELILFAICVSNYYLASLLISELAISSHGRFFCFRRLLLLYGGRFAFSSVLRSSWSSTEVIFPTTLWSQSRRVPNFFIPSVIAGIPPLQ